MSSGKLERLFHEDLGKLLESDLEREVNFSRIIIPFSNIFKSYKPIDIYSGTERIPFKEKDPEYKLILRQEFSNCMKLY